MAQSRRRSTTPQRASARAAQRHRKSNPLLPIVLVLGGGALIFGIWKGFSGTLNKNTKPVETEQQTVADHVPPTNAENPPQKPDTPSAESAEKTVDFLQKGILSYNTGMVSGQLHLPGWHLREADPNAPRWSALPYQDKKDFENSLAKRLTEDEDMRAFAAARWDQVETVPQSDYPLLWKLKSGQDPESSWSVAFTAVDGRWRVTQLEKVEQAAPVAESGQEGVAASNTAEPAGDQPSSAEQKPLFVEIKSEDGTVGRLLSGTIAKVEWVPGTTESEAKQIDGWVAEVLDEGGVQATRRLMEHRHKSIPFVMNRIVAMPLNSNPERIQQLAQLDALLERTTFRPSGFPRPGMTTIQDEQELHRRRQLALEGWFGWWNLWGEKWDKWAEEAQIPEPDPRRRGGRN